MDWNKASHNGFWLQRHFANGSVPFTFSPLPSHVKKLYIQELTEELLDMHTQTESWQHAMVASDHNY